MYLIATNIPFKHMQHAGEDRKPKTKYFNTISAAVMQSKYLAVHVYF